MTRKLQSTAGALAGLAIAIALACGLLLATAGQAAAQGCSVCATFVTTFDPDGSGGTAPKTRMHGDLIANVPYALDVDGNLAPLPVGILPLVPGYEVSATVEAIDSARPKITLRKLLNAPLSMPLRIEVLQQDEDSVWNSFGYDTLSSNAPRSFVANIDRSRAGRTYLDAAIGGATEHLTLVNEQFTGDPAGTRTARHVRRARFSGDNVKTRVPTRVTLDFTDTANQRLIVTRDLPTILDFEVSEPGNDPRVTGTVAEMPARVDLTLSEPDLNRDLKPDRKFDYFASSPVGKFTLKVQGSARTIEASVDNLPSEAHLTYAGPAEGLIGQPRETEITYHSNGRADRLELETAEPTGNGPRTLIADVRDVPQNIDRLSAISRSNGTTVVYDSDGRADHLNLETVEPTAGGSRALTADADNIPENIAELSSTTRPDGTTLVYDSDGRVDDLEVVYAARTGGALKRTKAHILGLPADVTIIDTSAPGEYHLDYVADGGAERADVEIVDDPDTSAYGPTDRKFDVTLDSAPEGNPTVVTPLPREVHIDAVQTPGKFDFDYRATGEIASAAMNASNLEGLPEPFRNLNLVLKRVPTALDLDTLTTDTATVHTEIDCQIQNANCPDPLPVCDFESPPLPPECVRIPTKTTTTTAERSDIEIASPQGRLGSAEIQLASELARGGPGEPSDIRLPAVAPNGRPQDGVLVHNVPEQNDNRDDPDRVQVIDVRLSEVAHVGLDQRATSTRETGTVQSFTKSSSTRIELDSVAADHALAFQQKNQNSLSQPITQRDALFATVPPGLTAEIKNVDDKLIHGLNSFTYGANGPVDGYDRPDGSRAPAFRLVETSSDTTDQRAIEVDPMPTTLTVCRVNDGTLCTAGIFDHGIERLANGDQDDGDCVGLCSGDHKFPISSDRANNGSLLITSNPKSDFYYEDGPNTIVDIRNLVRYGLQAHKVNQSPSCITPGDPNCQSGYIAMDTGSNPIDGVLKDGDRDAGSATTFVFPPVPVGADGWSADRHVLAFDQATKFAGAIGTVGPVTCPGETRLVAAGTDVTSQFCFAELPL